MGVDIDPSALPSELSIINTICKDKNLAHFDDVSSILEALSTNERLLVNVVNKNVVTIVKTKLVNGATPATHEMSFTMPMRWESKLDCTQ